VLTAVATLPLSDGTIGLGKSCHKPPRPPFPPLHPPAETYEPWPDQYINRLVARPSPLRRGNSSPPATNSSQQANDRYLDSKTQTLHCGTVQARRRDCRAWVSRREGAGCRARDLGLGRRTLLLGVLVVVRCSSSWRGRAAGGGGGEKETEKEGGGSRAAWPRNGSCRVPFGAGGLG